MEVVAAKDGNSNVERSLVDFDWLTDQVDVQQEKPVVEQSIGKHLVLPTEMFPTKEMFPSI